jgi:anhydro-N-acetylmuramic acid kinase
MSGTSADGVDAALVRIDGVGLDMVPTLLRHHHRDYDPQLRRTIFDIRARGDAKLSELAKLGRDISLTYAAAVNELLMAAGENAGAITAIAAHGQTLFHDPPNTIQWFDPALLAAETGCVVVSDFRRADCATGGQGAPLVPFADYILFRHPEKRRIVLNIGGIANLTYLQEGGSLDRVIAYDTGPGNCLSDAICRKFEPDGPGFDIGGERAWSNPRRIAPLLHALCNNPYFGQSFPKSTDTPAMIAIFDTACEKLEESFTVDDLLATAAVFVGGIIVKEVRFFSPSELIVSGGGVQNKAIMEYLRIFSGTDVRTTDQYGIASEAKEALAFALLACATLDGVASNVPNVTGAKRSVVLGAVTPKP